MEWHWRKKSLYREMIVKMTVFLILPFFLVTSVFYGRLSEDGERSYRSSEELLMAQARKTRTGYISNVMAIANRISSSNELKGFLLTKYTYRNWSYYAGEITRMVSGGLSYENTYVPKIYFTNSSIPRGFHIFYRLDDIADSAPIGEFLTSPRTEQWVTPPMAGEYPEQSPFTPFSGHYTYMRKVFSGKRLLYLLTVSVAARDMDSFLTGSPADGSLGAPQTDESAERLFLNYTGVPMSPEELDAGSGGYVREEISFEENRFPQKLVYLWAPNPQRNYFLAGSVLVVVFCFLSVFVNIQCARSMFRKITYCIGRFGESVKSGRYEPLRVEGEREIAQITVTFNLLIGKIQELTRLAAQQSALAKESQLKALQQQINPHFLYNTFEVFSYRMERYGHTEEADAMISFSGMLRYSLSGKGKYATIREELEQVNHYIRIQKLKYEEVVFEALVPSGLMEAKMIRFLLQPLVENSFTHGYCGRPLRILLSCVELKDRILVELCDNGRGISPARLQEVNLSLASQQEDRGAGIGLGNINRRLKLFYSERASLHVDSQEGAWTMVTFEIPK